MSNPAPCPPDLFKHGEVCGIFAANRGAESFESAVRYVSEKAGCRVDWHFVAGRAVVRAMPDDVASVKPWLPVLALEA